MSRNMQIALTSLFLMYVMGIAFLLGRAYQSYTAPCAGGNGDQARVINGTARVIYLEEETNVK